MEMTDDIADTSEKSDGIGGVCLVTQLQVQRAGNDHAHDLADIIAELTSVSVLTTRLPETSRLREDYEVVEFRSPGATGNVLTEAFQFLHTQIQLCLGLRKRDEDVVLFFGATSYLLPLLFARLLGKTVIVLPRGDVPLSLRLRWEESLPSVIARALGGSVSLLERLSYRFAHAIVTYTPSMARQLRLDRYEHKLYTSGARFVNIDQFDVTVPFEERERAVGFIGRLDVEKRIPELSEAARRLPADVRFVFVGGGNYREQLETELAAEQERGRVELVGWVDREEVPAQLNRLRLLIVPSHPTEGLPTTILEAMACGTPVLATPVSGVPDVVREGETGFLMNRTEPEQIATDVEAVLDRDDLEDHSHAARELVESEFSFEGAVKRWREILTDLTR